MSRRLRDAVQSLARVEPPAYVRPAARDERSPIFDEAIAEYAARRYQRAADGLRRVIASDPDDLPATFYLAVSLMMTDEVDEAIECLTRLVSADEVTLRRPASVLLAKAQMRTGALDAAERALDAAVRGASPEAAAAQDLLDRLRAARRRG